MILVKVDIEGHELDALPEWIESGVLEKVFARPDPFRSDLEEAML